MFGGGGLVKGMVICFEKMCLVCELGQDIQRAPETWLQERQSLALASDFCQEMGTAKPSLGTSSKILTMK